MGIALSVVRCLLLLDDDDDGPERLADHRVLNPYARIAEPPSGGTHLYVRPCPDSTTARSTATERLLSIQQPAVAASAWSSPRLAASAYTTRAGDPAPRPLGSATSTTLPARALSTPRLQQAHVESRAPSSSAETGTAVGREASADRYGLSYEVRMRSLSFMREVNRALPDAARTVVSSTPSCTPSPPAAVSPNQLSRASEASQRSVLVQGSGPGQNPAPPATSTPWCSQAAVAGSSTSVAVGTRPVKREVTSDVSRTAGTRTAMQQAASSGTETRETPALMHRLAKQSNQSQVSPSCTPSPPAAVSPNQLSRASEASQRSVLVQGSGPGQNPAPPATSTPWRSQAAVAGSSTSVAVGTRPVKREVTSDVSRTAGTRTAIQQAASSGTETRETPALKHRLAKQSNQSQVSVEKVAPLKMLETLAEKTRNGSSKSPIPVYEIPPHLKEMIKLDKVPWVLKEPLSASNYSEYFACLLYAEDFYLEKWSKYLLEGVSLEFHKRSSNNTILKDGIRYSKKTKDYVAFEVDSIPTKRPYILSRDFVFLQPLETNCQRIQGRVVSVRKSTKVLAEFEDDFWSQHSPEKRYDVSFSFNRVCLKRAHHAVANALGPLLFSFLFPEKVHKAIETTTQRFIYSRNLGIEQIDAVNQITNLKGFPPYLIAGPPCVRKDDKSCSLSLTKTGHTICEAILQIYKANSNCRILICTPKNITCDKLMIELSKEILESQQFRANAAFRDHEDVPDEILPSCQFNNDDQRFTCPPLRELQAFKAVTSTYMSSFRLRRAGIKCGHFTHIFLVDACAVAEPEAVVPLANLASEDTVVVISGGWDFPWYVRSDMARERGLKTSYFNRLLQRELYKNDSSYLCRLKEDSCRARSDTRFY